MKFEAANKSEKVTDRIIEQVRDAILNGRLKPGDRLASEKELIAQFGVAKATMREALRVLEAMGLLEIRKGTQGGVFVAEVDMKTTVHSIMNFLHFKSVSVRDITMLRFLIEPWVAHLAALVRSNDDIERLTAMVENGGADVEAEPGREISFHRYLARITGNPMLILIMDFVDNLLRDMKEKLALSKDFYEHVKKAHRRILDRIIAEDCVGARCEMAEDLLAVGDSMAEAAGEPPFNPAVMGFSRDGTYQRCSGKQPATAHESEPPSLTPEILSSGPATSEALSGGMLFRHLGSGDLYMMVLDGKKEDGKQ